MSNRCFSGPKEPQNLTGQVIIDKNEGGKEFWGNYSCVCLGRYKNELVAVKIIQRTGKLESMKRKVNRERMIWATVDHPNILPFYGFADDEEFAPFGAFVSPWCAKGDASRYLTEHGETMSLNDRVNLWKGVIQSIVYLHGHKPTIVHGDLKPGNILIDDSGTARICDFGLARIFLEEGHTDMTTTSEHTGTARYLAPELVLSDETVLPTTASDVYALGCLGLEFIYRQKPHADRLNNLRGRIYIDLRNGMAPATQKPRGSWPSCQIWPLISQMWDIEPLCRPSAFISGHKLDTIPFALPLAAVQRIAFFSATIFRSNGKEEDTKKWKCRCELLRALCLVSRTCKKYTIPFLYRRIRLYLRRGGPPLSGLIETLNHSNGYGRHTETLILITPSFHLDPWCGTCSSDVRHLLQMMPGLRCIVISTPAMFPFTTVIRSVANLEIRGSCASLFLQEECTLQVLSMVNRLSLVGGEPLPSGTSDPTFKPNVLSANTFPNIQAIDLQVDNQLLLDRANTLEIISGWGLPRLVSVQVEMRPDDPFTVKRPFNPGRADKYLAAFLGIRGHTIQYLSLSTVLYPKEVLRRCPNLRSLVISTPKVVLPEDFPCHLNLETIVSRSGAELNGVQSLLQIVQVQGIRGHSSVFLPKLKTAEFSWSIASGGESTRKISVSINIDGNGIFLNGVHQNWSLASGCRLLERTAPFADLRTTMQD